jgi:peptidoglycan hydrolase CwlO-like protein
MRFAFHLKVDQVVRQIALEFAYREKGKKLVIEDDDVSLAMAVALAESSRKAKAKITKLAPVAFPYWIVQVSDTESILLSAIGESSVTLELSENTAIGPVRRIISNETSEIKDIPEAIEKAIPLLREIEPKVHHIKNLQQPEIFVAQGTRYVEVDPNANINTLEIKMDSQTALSVSEDFQCLVEDAATRLDNIEELHRLTKEKLTDRLNALENVMAAELARWEKRHTTQEQSSELRMQKLNERLSDRIYRIKDRRKKDEKTLVADFVRETTELERFFAKIMDDIKGARGNMAGKTADIQEAVDMYRSLIDDLTATVRTFDDVANSLSDYADASLQKALDFDDGVATNIQEEEGSTDSQISELQTKMVDLTEEMDEKRAELNEMKRTVTEAVDKIDSLVEKRLEDLQLELQNVSHLTLNNNSIKDLAPLTLVSIATYVVTYNKGKPLVITPMVIPKDRFGLPCEHEPLDSDLDAFIQRSVKKLHKDSPSLKAALEKACAAGNVFQDPDSAKVFTSGIDRLWKRQLLKEGVKETLKPLFTKLVGKCHKCSGDIGTSGKYCPECGVSLH